MVAKSENENQGSSSVHGGVIRAIQGLGTIFTNGDLSTLFPQYISHDAATTGAKNRFSMALSRIRNLSSYELSLDIRAPLGYFGGRAIIGANSRVNGGVYLSPAPREAIVVDEKHGSLERIYNDLVLRLADLSKSQRLDEREILPEVASLTIKKLRYSPERYGEIEKKESIIPDQKVALDLFLYEGYGIARHQVLLAAFLLEKLRERQLLSGFACLDGYTATEDGEDERLIYTSPKGYLFVFDPQRIAKELR